MVDYKTNWLGAPDVPLTAADYRPERLAEAMGHSSYPSRLSCMPLWHTDSFGGGWATTTRRSISAVCSTSTSGACGAGHSGASTVTPAASSPGAHRSRSCWPSRICSTVTGRPPHDHLDASPRPRPGDGTKRHRSPGHLQPGRSALCRRCPRRHHARPARERTRRSTSRSRPLASRAVRHGSVAVDLRTIATDAAPATLGDADGDLELLPWPDAATWTDAVAVSALAQQRAPWSNTGSSTSSATTIRRCRSSRTCTPGYPGGAPVDGDLLDRGLARVFPGAGFAEQRAPLPTAQSTRGRASSRRAGDREDDHRRRRVGSARRAGGRRGSAPPPRRAGRADRQAAARVRGAVAEALSGILSRTPRTRPVP